MQRSASAVIIWVGNEIALQRRDDKAPTNPRKLSLFGGSAKASEAAHDCAVRELREETSIEFNESELVHIGSYYRDDVERMQHLYELKTDDNFEVYEGLDVEKYPLSTLQERTDLTDGVIAALAIYNQKKKGEVRD